MTDWARLANRPPRPDTALQVTNKMGPTYRAPNGGQPGHGLVGLSKLARLGQDGNQNHLEANHAHTINACVQSQAGSPPATPALPPVSSSLMCMRMQATPRASHHCGTSKLSPQLYKGPIPYCGEMPPRSSKQSCQYTTKQPTKMLCLYHLCHWVRAACS